jgi:hypothetical protein
MHQISAVIIEQVASLKSSRERYVLELRLGINTDRQHTLQEIADTLEVTRERIRQIQNKALSKLRNQEINAILLSAEISPSFKGTKRTTRNRPRHKSNAMLIQQAKIKPSSIEDCVVVNFKDSVQGKDQSDGSLFLSNRHRVRAEWARQDGRETLFITDGEIVAKWPTSLIELIKWPNGTDVPASPREFADRMAEIKQQYPKAWSKWSWEEEQNLISQFKSGMKISDIAISLGRAPGGIFSRLRKIELIPFDSEFNEEIVYEIEDITQLVTGSVYEVIMKLYAIDLSHSENAKLEKKFNDYGWFQPTDRLFKCPNCQKVRVTALRKHWKNMGRVFHRWAIICLECNKVGESRDFPDEIIETIHDHFDQMASIESICLDC